MVGDISALIGQFEYKKGAFLTIYSFRRQFDFPEKDTILQNDDSDINDYPALCGYPNRILVSFSSYDAESNHNWYGHILLSQGLMIASHPVHYQNMLTNTSI